jgi:hypothetical protein
MLKLVPTPAGDLHYCPLFFTADGGPLTLRTFDKMFGAVLHNHFGTDAGVYSKHSLRIGAATAMHALQYEGEAIRRTFSWTTVESQQLYSRQDAEHEADRVRAVRRCAPSAQQIQAAAAVVHPLLCDGAGNDRVPAGYGRLQHLMVVSRPSRREAPLRDPAKALSARGCARQHLPRRP